MSFAEIVKTGLEFAAVVLLIIGFINEKKVVAFEDKLVRAIKIHLRNRRLRKKKEAEKAYRAKVQQRAPEDFCFDEPPVLAVISNNSSYHVA